MGLMRKRLVPRFFSLDVLDIPAIESWLTDLAAKGLYYRKHNPLFLWFERGAPAAVRYRLDVVSPVSQPPEIPQADHTQAMGWRFIDKLGSYSVYFCDDPAAPELHTDPMTQSYTMDQLAQKLKKNMILAIALLIPTFGMVAVGMLLSPWPVLQMVQGSTMGVLMSLTIDAFLIVTFFAQATRFFALRRCLRAGLPFSHKIGYRRQRRVNLGVMVLSIIFALFAVYTAYRSITGRQTWNITPEMPSPLAFNLSHIEDSSDFQTEHQMIEGRNGEVRDMDHYVQFEWSPLAPVQYEVTEHGTVPGVLWADSSGTYSPSLRLAYYELPLPFLAEPLLEDLVYRHLDYNAYQTFTRKWLAAPGFDQLLLATEVTDTSGFQYLFARRGGRVLVVQYYGTADLAAHLPALAALLAGD